MNKTIRIFAKPIFVKTKPIFVKYSLILIWAVFIGLMINISACSDRDKETVKQTNPFSNYPSQMELDQYDYFLSDETLALAKKSGCKACHSVDLIIVGPAWKAVSLRFKDIENSAARLIEKITKGGVGIWSDGRPMPPYSPRVSDEDIALLVNAILFGESILSGE